MPPEDFSYVKSVIEGSLGRPLGEVFSWVDENALGSASIGQVSAALF